MLLLGWIDCMVFCYEKCFVVYIIKCSGVMVVFCLEFIIIIKLCCWISKEIIKL